MSPLDSSNTSFHTLQSKRNLHALILSASLLGAILTLHFALLQPLIIDLGGSIVVVGILTSVSSLAMMLPMLIFGEYSDTVGRRKPMLIASLFLAIAGFLYWGATNWIILIPAILLAGFAISLNNPASNAAMAESISEDQRGRSFAQRYTGRLFAGVLATLLGILIIRRGNINNAFALIILFAILNFLTIFFLLSETHLSPRPFSTNQLIHKLRNNWRIPPKLKYMYLYIAILDPLAFDTGWHLIYGLLNKYQGVTSENLLIFTLVARLTGGLLLLSGVAGRLADRSRKWGMITADIIAIFVIFLCAIIPGNIIFLIAFLGMGLADAFFTPAIQAYIVDRSPPDRVAAELGKIWSSRALISLFPPIFGGLLASTYGYSAPLLANVVIGVIGITVLIWKV